MFGIGVLIARTIWYDSYVWLARNENTKMFSTNQTNSTQKVTSNDADWWNWFLRKL